MSEPQPVIIQIPRADVTSCNTQRVLNILASWVPKLLERNRNRLRLEVTGYDSDSRELYDIPEVRPYFARLVADYPGLFYWIDFRSYMYSFMALMLYTPVRVAGGVTVSSTDIGAYMARGFVGLNRFCTEHSVSPAPTNALFLSILSKPANA